MEPSIPSALKPSGWIRLWLLLVVLWLICVLAFFAHDFPSEELLRARKVALNDSALRWSDPKTYAHNRCGGVEGTSDYMSCLKSADYAGAVKAYNEEREQLASAVKPYVEENLTTEQMAAAKLAVIWWLAPSLATLLLFAALRWVIRGFKAS